MLNREPIKNWFGHSRKERRSAFILLIIIILIIGYRYTIPEKELDVEYVSSGFSPIEGKNENIKEDKTIPIRLFYFDPNSASYDTLIKLGLASKEANTLIKYRNKGGRFKYPSDIKKIYGIDSVKAEKLIPYAEITANASEKLETHPSLPQKSKLEINTCDSASLVRLPGIGPVLSARIIKYRHLIGGYARIEQLKEVYGLPADTYELIKGRISADTLFIKWININSADYKELSHLPYLEQYEIDAILKYRQLIGRVTSINDLVENRIISAEKAIKIRPYMRFE
jgi:competence protein ComEA